MTDHRINLTLYSLDQIMEGEGLDEIVDGLTAERQAGTVGRAGYVVTPVPRLPPFTPGMRIGLLGGSFNPPHEGHALITRLALRQAARPRVVAGDAWQPAALDRRLALRRSRPAAARRLHVRPRVVVSDVEAQIGSHFCLL